MFKHQPFREVFDATSEFNDTTTLLRIPCTELIVGDLVLVQAKLRRASSVAGWDPRAPSAASVWFEMETVYRLCARLGMV